MADVEFGCGIVGMGSDRWLTPRGSGDGAESYPSSVEIDLPSRARSFSMSHLASPTTAAIKSKLDPNSKPFSPRQSPKSRKESSTLSSDSNDVQGSKYVSYNSMDSGYDDKKLDIDWRMRNELEKFEDGDDKVRRLLNFSGPSSSKSSIESANLSSLAGNVSTSSGNGSFHDEAISEDVFLPSKPGLKPKAGFGARDEPSLLPTPEDFPPFGPVIRRRPVVGQKQEQHEDKYGLRALVKTINQTAAIKDREQSSVFSLNELGFSQEFCDNYHPKRNFVASSLHNLPVTLLNDDVNVPPEYRHGYYTSKKLPEPDLRHCPSDVLFFLFYTAVEDSLQLSSACELFRRGWRFHKKLKIWLGCMNRSPTKGCHLYEQGKYQYFNVQKWARDAVELVICYEDVAGIELPSPGSTLPQDRYQLLQQARVRAGQREELQRLREQQEIAQLIAANQGYEHELFYDEF